MRFSVGEMARLGYSRIPDSNRVGMECVVRFIGPWKVGDINPLGCIHGMCGDYLVEFHDVIANVTDAQLIKLTDPDQFEAVTEDEEIEV